MKSSRDSLRRLDWTVIPGIALIVVVIVDVVFLMKACSGALRAMP